MARIETDNGKCSACGNEGTTYFWTETFQTCLSCLTKAQQTLARIEAGNNPLPLAPPGIPAVAGRPTFSAQPAHTAPPVSLPPRPQQPAFNPNDPIIKRFEAGIKASIEEHNGDILGTEVERIFKDIGMRRGYERPLATFLKAKYGFPEQQFLGMASRYFVNQSTPEVDE